MILVTTKAIGAAVVSVPTATADGWRSTTNPKRGESVTECEDRERGRPGLAAGARNRWRSRARPDEGAHHLVEGTKVTPTEHRVANPGHGGDARERMPERGAAEPGDVGKRGVRCPEALGPRHALASVLEDARDRVAGTATSAS